MKRGDLVRIIYPSGQTELAVYWFRAHTGQHVVLFEPKNGERYPQFMPHDAVRLEAACAAYEIDVPEWARW